MSKSLNVITLLGHVGNDPETRAVGTSSVTAFSLATSRQWNDASGTKQEKTEWHRCNAWDQGKYKLGEIAGSLLRKGTRVHVTGSLEYRKWTNKENVEVTTAEIRVTDLIVLSDKPREESAPAPRAKAPANADDFPTALADEDDDLPF